MILDRTKVMVETVPESDKRLVKLLPDAPDGVTTILLPDGHSSGVHTAEFSIVSCESTVGGVFLGVAEASSTLASALGCADGRGGTGWGWGKGMPYVQWVQEADDSWLKTKTYPYYKLRQTAKVGCRHNLYSLDPKQVLALLDTWGMKNYLPVFAAAKLDGKGLEMLDSKTIKSEYGVRNEYDNNKLCTRLKELFQEQYSYKKGDSVRLVLDMDKGELKLMRRKGEDQWVPVGEALKGLKGKTLHFGITLSGKKDMVEFVEFNASSAAMPSERHSAVYPSLKNWKYAQGLGSGAFAQDYFTVIRHGIYGTVLEIPHEGGQCIAFQACDKPSGYRLNLFHPEMFTSTGDAINACAWRAPDVVKKLKGQTLQLYGAQEGIEWKVLGRIGEARAVKGACKAGQWIIQMEIGKGFQDDNANQLGYGTEVINLSNSEQGIRLTLTSLGFVLQNFTSGGLVCLRGEYPTFENQEETLRARAIDGTAPVREGLRSFKSHSHVIPPVPSSKQIRDDLMGEALIPEVVPVTTCYGDDPLANYNYTAQRAYAADSMRYEKVSSKSNLLAMSHKDTDTRLQERKHALRFREEGVEKAARELGSAMTGWGVKAGRAKVARLKKTLQDDTDKHALFEQRVRDEAASKFPVKSTGGPTTLHGPGFLPYGDARAQSSSRARSEDWMRRVGKPGGSAGTLRDPWGQKRWAVGGEWLNLHPPIDRFRPMQG